MTERSIEPMSSEAEDHACALLDLSIALVDAGSDVLSRHIRTDGELKKQSVLMPGGTVGKHFRHVSRVLSGDKGIIQELIIRS